MKFLYRLRQYTLRHTGGTLILLTILSAGSLYKSLDLQKSIALSESIPQQILVDAGYYDLKSEFKTADPVIIRLSKPDESKWTENEFCLLRNWHNDLQNHPEIDFMSTVFDLRQPVIESADSGTPKLFFPSTIADSCSENYVDLNTFNNLKIKKIFSDPSRNAFFSYLYLTPQSDPEKFDSNRLRRLVDHLESFNQYKISITGSQIFQMYAKENLDRLNLLNGLAIVLILFILKYLFGTWKSGVLLTITLLFTMTVVKALMAFVGHKVDSLLSSLFLILAIAVTQDLIFTFDEMAKSGSRYLRASRKLLISSFFTTLTTVVGFGSLVVSSHVPNIVRFGAWAAFGALLEWICIFIFLPTLVKKYPSIEKNIVKKTTTKTAHILRWNLKPIVAIALTMIVFLNPVFMSELKVNHYIMDSFVPDHKLAQFTEEIRHSHGWENSINVIFNSDISLQDREHLLEQAKKISGVVFVSGPQLLTENVNAPPFLKKFVSDQIYETRWGQFFKGHTGKLRAEVFFKVADSQGVARISDEMNKICDGRCAAAGEILAFAVFSRLLLDTLKDSYFVSLLLVGLLMLGIGLSLRQKDLGIYLLTSAIGPSSIAATFYVLSIPIDIITSIALSVAVGLAGDNVIQYMFANRNHKSSSGLEARGVGSLTSTLVMIVLCLPLLLSDFRALRWSAVILSLGFVLGFIGDYWVLKSLLSLKKIISFKKHE